MNGTLFAPLSNYRERVSKLTGISNKGLLRIKAESEKVVGSHEARGWSLATLTSVKYV